MKIIKLEASNVKRLKAVSITPKGDTVVIGGRNGQGKTSILDSIAAALGGKKCSPEVPIRQGEAKAHVVVDLGDVIVRRRWKAGSGSTLTVENKDGSVYRSPQAILDALVGRLTFDPLAFLRDDPKRQLETLRELVGIDTTGIDQTIKDLYEQRRDVNRDLKAIQARLEAMPHHDGEHREVSVAALMKELEHAREHNDRVTSAKETCSERAQAVAAFQAKLQAVTGHWDQEIARLQALLMEAKSERGKAIAAAERELEKAEGDRWCAEDAADRLELVDTAPIETAIRGADEANRKARENAAWQDLATDAALMHKSSEILSADLEKLQEERRKLIESASFPVEGLGLDDDGVRFNGLPLSQASSAEQLRVSVAMGLAMNPKLRVLLIRDGSLLDEQSLATVAAMAAEQGGQVWIERVSSTGEGCHVVVEDGEVVDR